MSKKSRISIWHEMLDSWDREILRIRKELRPMDYGINKPIPKEGSKLFYSLNAALKIATSKRDKLFLKLYNN